LRLPSNLAAHAIDEAGVVGSARARVHAAWPGVLESGEADAKAAWLALWKESIGEAEPY
jgi:hypothetical protein